MKLRITWRELDKPVRIIYDRRLIREWGREYLEALGILPEIVITKTCEQVEYVKD